MEGETASPKAQEPGPPTPEAPPPANEQDDRLAEVLSQFITSIEGLATSFPVTTGAIQEAARSSAKELIAFLEEHATNVQRPATPQVGKFTINFTVESGHEETATSLSRKIVRVGKALSLVPGSLFVSLVSAYDHFLGN